MEEIVIFSSILMTGLAALLLIVSFISYLRMRTLNMMFLVAAFSIFIVKGILLLTEIADQSTGLVILDVFIIVFLYLTIARR
jgi:hypothetical protein